MSSVVIETNHRLPTLDVCFLCESGHSHSATFCFVNQITDEKSFANLNDDDGKNAEDKCIINILQIIIIMVV